MSISKTTVAFASLLLTAALAPPDHAVAVTWTGAPGDATNWGDAGNWDSDPSLPGAADDVTLDGGSGTYNDAGGDGDVDLFLNTDLTINSLFITGNFNGGTAGETHQLMDGNTNTLTIDGVDGSGRSIHYNAPDSEDGSGGNVNHSVEFDSPIVFTTTDPVVIRRDGNSSENKRLIFNRDVTATDLDVILNNNNENQNDAIRFDFSSETAWDSTTIERGAVLLSGGDEDMTLGDAGSTVTMATADGASLYSDPGGDDTHTVTNEFVLGTAGRSRLRVLGTTGSTETWEITGSVTGGDTGVDLDLDADNDNALVFTSTSEIDIDSRIHIEGTSQAASRITFDGTITGADGGFFFESDADRTVDGSGTIAFDFDGAITAGPTNFGDSPIDVNAATFDISGMTADLNVLTPLTPGDIYVLIDYTGGTLTGTFSSVLDLPGSGKIVYNFAGGTQVVLFVPEPSTFGLLALAGALVLPWRRRRS